MIGMRKETLTVQGDKPVSRGLRNPISHVFWVLQRPLVTLGGSCVNQAAKVPPTIVWDGNANHYVYRATIGNKMQLKSDCASPTQISDTK